jgi:hypothetical protein
MQQQTTQMAGQGYEAGLGRYVQDRNSTLQNLLGQRQLGGQLGMQGAELMNSQQLARLREGAGLQQAGFQTRGALEQALMSGNVSMLNQAMAANAGVRQAGIGAQATTSAAGISAAARNAQTNLQAQLAAANLAQQGAGFGTDIGNSLIEFGGLQQGANQNNVDWYNKQYNAGQDYPQNRFGDYVDNTSMLTQPGQRPGLNAPNNSGQPTYDSTAGGAVEGARAGIGLYNDFSDAWGGGGGGAGPTSTGPGGGNSVPPGPLPPGYIPGGGY